MLLMMLLTILSGAATEPSARLVLGGLSTCELSTDDSSPGVINSTCAISAPSPPPSESLARVLEGLVASQNATIARLEERLASAEAALSRMTSVLETIVSPPSPPELPPLPPGAPCKSTGKTYQAISTASSWTHSSNGGSRWSYSDGTAAIAAGDANKRYTFMAPGVSLGKGDWSFRWKVTAHHTHKSWMVTAFQAGGAYDATGYRHMASFSGSGSISVENDDTYGGMCIGQGVDVVGAGTCGSLGFRQTCDGFNCGTPKSNPYEIIARDDTAWEGKELELRRTGGRVELFIGGAQQQHNVFDWPGDSIDDTAIELSASESATFSDVSWSWTPTEGC